MCGSLAKSSIMKVDKKNKTVDQQKYIKRLFMDNGWI